MKHSELRGKVVGSNDEIVIVSRGSVTGKQLLAQQKRHQDLGSAHTLRLCLVDHRARFGMPVASVNSVPVYVHVKAIVSDGTSFIEAFEINYITFYAYNGEYAVVPGLIHAGAHDGDIEHITARVCPDTGDLLAMWYNSHRPRDGEWVGGDLVPRAMPSGRPIAYVALHGHGTYPRTGTIHRHFWLGNDKCSDQGVMWDPERLILLPNEHRCCSEPSHLSTPLCIATCNSRGCLYSSVVNTRGPLECSIVPKEAGAHHSHRRVPMVTIDDPCDWLFFRGEWGQTPAIIQQSWYWTAESPVSRTPLQRLFFHHWPEVESLLGPNRES